MEDIRDGAGNNVIEAEDVVATASTTETEAELQFRILCEDSNVRELHSQFMAIDINTTDKLFRHLSQTEKAILMDRNNQEVRTQNRLHRFFGRFTGEHLADSDEDQSDTGSESSLKCRYSPKPSNDPKDESDAHLILDRGFIPNDWVLSNEGKKGIVLESDDGCISSEEVKILWDGVDLPTLVPKAELRIIEEMEPVSSLTSDISGGFSSSTQDNYGRQSSAVSSSSSQHFDAQRVRELSEIVAAICPSACTEKLVTQTHDVLEMTNVNQEVMDGLGEQLERVIRSYSGEISNSSEDVTKQASRSSSELRHEIRLNSPVGDDFVCGTPKDGLLNASESKEQLKWKEIVSMEVPRNNSISRPPYAAQEVTRERKICDHNDLYEKVQTILDGDGNSRIVGNALLKEHGSLRQMQINMIRLGERGRPLYLSKFMAYIRTIPGYMLSAYSEAFIESQLEQMIIDLIIENEPSSASNSHTDKQKQLSTGEMGWSTCSSYPSYVSSEADVSLSASKPSAKVAPSWSERLRSNEMYTVKSQKFDPECSHNQPRQQIQTSVQPMKWADAAKLSAPSSSWASRSEGGFLSQSYSGRSEDRPSTGGNAAPFGSKSFSHVNRSWLSGPLPKGKGTLIITIGPQCSGKTTYLNKR